MILHARLAPEAVTLERLDPLSAAAARPVTRGIALLALALPVLVLLTRSHEVTQPLWLIVAAASLLAAVWLLLDRSRVHRPLWRTASVQVLHLLLLLVVVASVASTFGANAHLRDDWAPLVIGMLLVALTPYRPAREIVFWTVVHTAVCAMLGLLQAPYAITDAPALSFAVTGSWAVAILGFAGAAYARSLNASIQLWHDRAWRAAAATAIEHRGSVARSVQQRRVTLLNRDVVPYLSRIVEAETITDADREDARLLARSIRALLVADVEKGWAQTMLDELVSRHPRLAIVARADDPHDLGGRATLERRTVLRALASISVERLAASELDLAMRSTGDGIAVRWSVATPRPFADARRELRSMAELLRGLAERSSIREEPGRLVLEFEYGY